MRHKIQLLDLFSGIGGFSLAAAWTKKINTVGFCEKNKYARQILKKNWPEVPVFEEIRDLTYERFKRQTDFFSVDIISAGFPCQPFSVAGRQKGTRDDRYLWPEMFRVIREFQPAWVLCENVTNFVNMAFKRTKIDLENENYEVQSFIIPACAIGAPHKRDRLWILAHSNGIDDNNARFRTSKISQLQKTKIFPMPNWEFEPRISRMANGIPNRVDRCKCLGNAIVPHIAYIFFEAILQTNNLLCGRND